LIDAIIAAIDYAMMIIDAIDIIIDDIIDIIIFAIIELIIIDATIIIDTLHYAITPLILLLTLLYYYY
jgi:hypothetical protein